MSAVIRIERTSNVPCPMENKTARLTVLIDPAKKEAFEELCHSQDMTPSQVTRRLIREFMEQHAAAPALASSKTTPARKPAARKRG
jgi:hypothetical protein